MVPILSKSAEQIGIRDIEALIESRVPEGEQIEFKGALPAKDNSSDPWMCGKRLGERAKREILQESVAFANAYGGAFVLGVEESSNKPPTATRIQPIPRCTELAECLKHMFRDCVEPQIPRIEIFGVPIEDDSGVVVVRVGRSRLAPHRVTSTLVCPVRRSDRCERMSMREIQDLTLNMSRGLERLDRVLRARAERFHEEFECLSTPKDAFGLRMTAVPIGEEIRLDPVYRGHDVVQDFVEPWHWVYRRGTDPVQRLKFSDDSNLQPNFWRPMLRAARAEPYPDFGNNNRFYSSYQELYCDGLIERGFVSNRAKGAPMIKPNADSFNLEPDLPILLFANLAVWADLIRHQAHVASAEYAIETEFRVVGGPVHVKGPNDYLVWETLQPGLRIFPRYSLGDSTEIPQLLNLFCRDFWNFLGKSVEETSTLVIENWSGQEFEDQ